MPGRQTSCISQDSREAVGDLIDLYLEDATGDEKKTLEEIKSDIDDMPNCGNKRGPRQPSAYNLYMKDCFKEPDIKALSTQPERMKKCAVKWNDKKKQAK